MGSEDLSPAGLEFPFCLICVRSCKSVQRGVGRKERRVSKYSLFHASEAAKTCSVVWVVKRGG